MDIEEVVEKLRKYGINATEKELMEKEKTRLIKNLKQDYESGYTANIVTMLKELEAWDICEHVVKEKNGEKMKEGKKDEKKTAWEKIEEVERRRR